MNKNTAQLNLIEIAKNVKRIDRNENVLNFLRDCFKAWEGYSDDRYSSPSHQLRVIEKNYGFTVSEINKRYEYEVKKLYQGSGVFGNEVPSFN